MADAYFGGCENERSEGDRDDDDDDGAQSDDVITWEGTPRRPELLVDGAIVHLVCSVEGVVKKVDMGPIPELPSYMAHEVYESFEVGCAVEATRDIKTDGGWIHLIGETVDEDWKVIEAWMGNIWTVEKLEEG